MPEPTPLFPVSGEVRLVSLSIEQQTDRLWRVVVHVEHRVKGRKRALLQRVSHFTIRVDHTVASIGAVEELLAQAVLQRRLPGID